MPQQLLAADAFVDRDQAAVTEVGADLADRLEGQRRVELVGADEAAQRPADLDRARLAAVAEAAAELGEDAAQRRPELDLVGAGAPESLVQADDLGAAAVADPEAGVGVAAAVDDPGDRARASRRC